MENRIPLKRKKERKVKTEGIAATGSSRQSGNNENASIWTLEEDSLITEFVKNHGPRHWKNIARLIPGRSGEQCKERWLSDLKPKTSEKVRPNTLFYVAPDYRNFECDESLTAQKIIQSILIKRFFT